MPNAGAPNLSTILAALVRAEDERPIHVDEHDPYAADVLMRLAASLAGRAVVFGRCAGKTLAKVTVEGFQLDVVEVDCPPPFVVGLLRWSNDQRFDAFPWVGDDGLSISPSRMTEIGLTFGDLIMLEKQAHAMVDAAELLEGRKGSQDHRAGIPWDEDAADVAAKDGEETC